MSQPTKLNSENPEYLVYDNSYLHITVMGGIKLEGLHRLQTTLKIRIPENPKPPIRHQLDLYNDTSLETLIGKICERLELGRSVVEASFHELIEELENYRLAAKTEKEEIKEEPLTEEEAAIAKADLETENLMEITSQCLGQSGIVGEENNRMNVYLSMTSRLCKNPVSSTCIAKSGAGKSYLMERVAKCFPEAELISGTQFTEGSFYRFGEYQLQHKVIIVKDLDGAQNILYPMRELLSEQEIRKRVTIKGSNGEPKSGMLIVKGPVVIIACTTKENIYEDNSNRVLELYLDESKEQEEQVLKYTRNCSANLVDKEAQKQIQKRLQNIQRLLKPIKVVNPYAPLCTLPEESFKRKRTQNLLIYFIEAITFYHQEQRPRQLDDQGVEYIETTPEDIEWAFRLLGDVLFRKSDQLKGSVRSLYEWLKQWPLLKPDKEKGKQECCFNFKELQKERKEHPRTLRRYLRELVEFGLVDESFSGRIRSYSLDVEAAGENLQGKVELQIAAVLERVRVAARELAKSESLVTVTE